MKEANNQARINIRITNSFLSLLSNFACIQVGVCFRIVGQRDGVFDIMPLQIAYHYAMTFTWHCGSSLTPTADSENSLQRRFVSLMQSSSFK
jgi:hypothetical protein